MKIRIATVLLVLFFSVSSAMCQEPAPSLKNNTFVLAMIRPADDYLGKWWRMAYTELFKRLGIKVEFRDYPPKRASIEADAGNVDGEPGRIYPYADEHPNLIRLEELLFHLNFSAITAQDSIPPLSGWESLKGTDYRVEYQRGIKICENNLPRFVKKENLTDVTDTSQGLKKVISHRIDLFVDEESGMLTLLQRPEFKGSKVRVAGVMESAPVYPYLHKKHALLAPKMTETLKAMKAEGLIEQYRMMLDKEFGVVR